MIQRLRKFLMGLRVVFADSRMLWTMWPAYYVVEAAVEVRFCGGGNCGLVHLNLCCAQQDLHAAELRRHALSDGTDTD
jgi:hypothetical protein